MSKKSAYILFKIKNKIVEKTHGRLMKNGYASYERIAKEGIRWGLLCSGECISAIDGNKNIYNMLVDDKPCMIARIGTVECGMLDAYYRQTIGLKGNLDRHLSLLCQNAGFFPNDITKIPQFCDLYFDAFRDIDILGVFGGHKEDYFISEYMPQTKVIQYTALEPYYFTDPWSRALSGKKVLVIHPFAETIANQYKRRKLLFENSNILPEFELDTIKAVQSVAGNNTVYTDWFEALNSMKKQISSKNFDVAIIGCGAYGLPLAHYVKSIGKKSVLTAGATQIIFGIKGKRWNNHPTISKLYNKYWTVPMDSDRPTNADKVEGGCYW